MRAFLALAAVWAEAGEVEFADLFSDMFFGAAGA